MKRVISDEVKKLIFSGVPLSVISREHNIPLSTLSSIKIKANKDRDIHNDSISISKIVDKASTKIYFLIRNTVKSINDDMCVKLQEDIAREINKAILEATK